MTHWGSVETTLCSMGDSLGQWDSTEINGGQLGVTGHGGSLVEVSSLDGFSKIYERFTNDKFLNHINDILYNFVFAY